VLRATMMNGIGGHIDSTDIVAEDDHRRRDGCVRNSTIPSLRTRTRDRSLSFGGPGD
jgi:hypothetical protein